MFDIGQQSTLCNTVPAQAIGDDTFRLKRLKRLIASGQPEDDSFQPANEERLTQEWPAPRADIIRSEITFFETAQGGAVFSVGSISFIGGLPIDGYVTSWRRCWRTGCCASPNPRLSLGPTLTQRGFSMITRYRLTVASSAYSLLASCRNLRHV